MKDYNKILYDILLKIEISTEDKFRINKELVIRYFQDLDVQKMKNIGFEIIF